MKRLASSVTSSAILVIAVLLFGIAAPASAEVVEATLVEDTFVNSLSPGTNFDGSADEIWIRNHSTVSRLGLFQFTLPQLPAGMSGAGVLSATLVGVPARVSTPSLEVVGVEVNPDLTTLTYNNAVSLGIIDSRDASYNFVYGPNAEGYTQLWSTAGASVDSPMFYTDGTAGDGLLGFIQSLISDAAPVTITIGIGPTGGAGTTDFRFYSMESNVGGPPMALTLDIVPEPGCVALGLSAMTAAGLLFVFRRRRR